MADRRASAFVFLLVVLAVAAGGWFLFRGSAPPKPVPPDSGEAPVDPAGDGSLAFLKAQAAPARPPKGTGPVPMFPAVRMDALDALVAVAPAAAEPSVLAALGGDGNPEEWSEERLHAAWIRIRAGQADGAATVLAYLKGEESLGDSDASVEAARAATAMPRADGAGVVRRLLAEKPDALGDEVLAAALQAAASLGDGATPEELKKHLASDEWLVRGAAAGALLKLGDGTGAKLAQGLEWPDSEDFARGLGVAGNEAALPALETLLKAEEGFARAAAVRAVGIVGGAKATGLLQGALKDADPDVKAAAAVALATLGSRDDLAATRLSTADKDPEVAVAAWKALALLGDAGSRDAAVALLATPPPSPKDGARGLALQKRVWAAALMVKLGK